MRFALERVANRKGRVWRKGQAIGRGKRLPNVAPRVALHLGIVTNGVSLISNIEIAS
jgi:hypothetical protein